MTPTTDQSSIGVFSLVGAPELHVSSVIMFAWPMGMPTTETDASNSKIFTHQLGAALRL